MAKISKYGFKFDTTSEADNGDQLYDDVGIEMFMIKKGEDYLKSKGSSLSFHFENFRKIVWPHLDDHRWHNLCRDEILSHKVCVLMGPGSSGKTHESAWISLTDYWCWPDITCVLVSSTDIRGLKKRVWGEITDLWEIGVEKFPKLSGHLLDSAIALTTDDIEDCEAGQRKIRDMRKGIFGVPCVQGGSFVGLSKFLGIKQKRMRLVADEASMMGQNFLSAFANLNKNEDFRAIVLGNPNDPLDPLGKAAEPKEGWTDDYMEPTKTTCWNTRFMNGRCVNLVGLDSPNFDYPEDQPTKFKYLISREKIKNTLSFFPKDSLEYYSQCVGVMKVGMLARRVITRDLCEKFGALEDVVFDGAHERTLVAGLDSAYDGDRCALTVCEMGKTLDGKVVLRVQPAVIVPVTVKSDLIPEDQISEFCKTYCEDRGILPQNFGHDSTGRGSLGTSLARVWSAKCHPVEFGGQPTARPVSLDLFVQDEATGAKRLKRCDEHFSKWVSEAWYVVRMAIEAGQIRNLPEETMEEGCLREFSIVKGNRIEIEPKRKMKERIGRSPDLFDSLAICIEIARRKGFQISKMAVDKKKNPGNSWLDKHLSELQSVHEAQELQTV